MYRGVMMYTLPKRSTFEAPMEASLAEGLEMERDKERERERELELELEFI